MRACKAPPATHGLPSSPPRWIEVLDDPFRPQPRLDRDTHGGMATSVGRIREDGVLENGVKFVLVSHNTKMGAARGAVLLAELLKAQCSVGAHARGWVKRQRSKRKSCRGRAESHG